jgi:hypothetical protein
MKYLILLAFLFCSSLTFCQTSLLKEKEEKLKTFAGKMINAGMPEVRLKNDSLFTREFVQALKVPHSFNYTFDSLYNISQLYAPDSSFRIFTWQLVLTDYVTRQHGAIQMHTPDGSLKLFPLIDKSDISKDIDDTTGDNLGWIGAVYYKMFMKQAGKEKIYVLLGYDENNLRSTKKVIEILRFREGKPWFGGNGFFADSTGKVSSMARKVIEFKKDASPRLVYDPELDMIIMEHLVSETNQPYKKFTLVGDGDYEGYKWKDNRWNYVGKVFNEVTEEGKTPMPQPIYETNTPTTEGVKTKTKTVIKKKN